MTEGNTVNGRNDWGAILTIAKHYFHLMPTEADREDLVSAVAEGWSYGLSNNESDTTTYPWRCAEGYAKNHIRKRMQSRQECLSGIENAEMEPFESAVERHESSMASIAMGHRLDEVLAVVATLPEVEREVIERRYLKGEKFRETAEAMGVSRQRVDQIEKRALRKLREICNPRQEG